MVFLAGILGLILNLVSLGKAESYLFSPYNSLYIFWNSADVRNLNSFISFSEYLSFFWAILFLMIGYFWYAGKGIKGAFLASNRKITFSVLFVLIASGVFYMVQKPSAYKAGKEGITIHGKLDTNLKIDSIKIYTADFHKEIASIPVQNNTFAWTSTKNLPFDEYVMEYAGKNVKLMMGSGDWFDLLIQCDAASNDIFMKSNRKAEQSYQEQENFGRSFSIILDKDSPEDPKTFYDVAQSDWKDNIKKLNKYTNAENQALSDEYKEYRKQLLAIRYLNEINNYRKITSLSDPKFAAPKEFLEELNENIQKPTYLLNKNEEYLQYKLDKVFEDNGSPNPDSILFTKLDLLPKGLDRDRLLAKHLKKNIELEPDSTSRNKIFAAQINKIQNQDYKNMLYSSLEQINLSQKGSPFPDLILENDKGKTIKLSKYKGKYVVIDIWASWCAPCKTIRPVFETRSYQNRYVDNIQFISVSVDADKGKWINSLKAKPSQIPQYWLPNPEKLMDKYKIQTIPRFIIVDPEGKIFNLNTPFPDEDNFVEILDKLKKY
ncbi:thioredoxin-like domain-containing protein [Chryseobacterium wanjuense]